MMEILIALAALIAGTAAGFALSSRRASAASADARVAQERAAQWERRAADETRAAAEREERLILEHERYVAQVRTDQNVLRDQFRALSAEALQRSQEALLTAAQERLTRERQASDADLAKREQAVRQLVEPVAAALEQVRKQTSEADRARAATEATLTEQLARLFDTSDKLRQETAGLKSALRRPEVRGRWGELHLRRVVELAGLVDHVDFVEQATAIDDGGRRLRPDMLVHLAGERTIVVDAKTPLDAMLDGLAAEDERERTEALDRHVAHVRKRVTELRGKDYEASIGASVEFTVLFLPAESFLQAAVERDPAIQEWAFEQRVVIATPTILVALLRTVGHAWKQQALARDAQQIADAGRELYDRLSTMGRHLAKLGASLESAGRAYNETVGSLERRVLPTARKFAHLQQIDAEIETRSVDVEARALVAPELASDADADAE